MKSIRRMIFSSFFWLVSVNTSILSLLAYFYLTSVITQSTIDDQYESLKSIAQHIHHIYENIESEIDAFYTAELKEEKDLAKFQKNLERFLSYHAVLSTAHYYDVDGNLLVAAKKPEMVDYEKARNYYSNPNSDFLAIVEKAYQENKIQVSRPFYTKRGYAYQLFVKPLFTENGTRAGILSCAIFPSLLRIDRFLKGLALNPKNFIAVLDIDGNIIALNGIEEEQFQPTIETFLKERGVNGDPLKYKMKKDPEELVHNVGEEKFYYVSEVVKPHPLIAVIGVKKTFIQKKGRKLINYIYVMTGMSFLLALVISTLLANRVLKPMNQIAEAIRQMDQGNFSHQIKGDDDSEFGHLMNTLDHILRKLKKGKFLGHLWSEYTQDKDESNKK